MFRLLESRFCSIFNILYWWCDSSFARWRWLIQLNVAAHTWKAGMLFSFESFTCIYYQEKQILLLKYCRYWRIDYTCHALCKSMRSICAFPSTPLFTLLLSAVFVSWIFEWELCSDVDTGACDWLQERGIKYYKRKKLWTWSNTQQA